MQKTKNLVKRAFTPITIMLIPHSDARSLRMKIPSIGVVASVILWAVGMMYVASVAIDAFEYRRMKEKLDYYSGQFLEMKSTMMTLKRAESQFRKIFFFNSKEKILENLDTSDNGSIDMENLKFQLNSTMETIGEIRDYLSQQKDIYLATPKGWPADGRVTSVFGGRVHPKSGVNEFHSGIDIASEPGRPVRATADGIVIFSGWSGGNGNLVAIEHGFGFSTLYAHNKMVAVKLGQKVKRGDIIGYIGSTGNSTGPHVHYEVWRSGKPVNPHTYIDGRS
ncbi:MAG: M23 family metallopeptidase [Nitrospirae bacterium]|nr:M23 family metallopeptidase [Nitrospirota bacterium]